jgi:hypothetical protein
MNDTKSNLIVYNLVYLRDDCKAVWRSNKGWVQDLSDCDLFGSFGSERDYRKAQVPEGGKFVPLDTISIDNAQQLSEVLSWFPKDIEVRCGQLFGGSNFPLDTFNFEIHINGVDAQNAVVGTDCEVDRLVLVIEMRSHDSDEEVDGWFHPSWR